VIDLPPVRDVHGHVVWRVKLASAREMTCTVCGETTVDEYCIRCATEADLNQRYAVRKAGTLVPTMSYLHEDEYERNG
jgi:hypothetical protein